MRKFVTLLCAGALASGLAIAQEDAKPKAGAGDAAKGKEVFEQCAACHNVDTDEKKMGPSLKGLFKKEKLTNGKPVTEENVMAVIKAGGNGMPGYADLLTDEERANVLAYLKTL
jgi:mono/diheme cytochrome c family protein